MLERDLNMNLPTTENRSAGYRETDNQRELNNYKLKDKINKYVKYSELKLKHNPLTDDLVRQKYINNKSQHELFLFDKLFNDYLLNGKSYMELFGAIHYIVLRIISRNFIDEDGNKIANKYGYFKNFLESNFKK